MSQLEETWERLTCINQPKYFVSNYGQIKNIQNQIHTQNPNIKGYCKINIQGKGYQIHRLVSLQFIPNPKNLPIVDHIDGNRSNNKVNNLQWVNHQENKQKQNIFEKHSSGKKVIQVDPITKVHLKIWESISQADRILKCNVLDNLKGKSKTAAGYIWKYAEDLPIEGEIWKQCQQYTDLEVSNFGRVRKGALIMEGSINAGYRYVRGKISIHRLVAFEFLPNPTNLKFVHHKDNNRTNNHVDNLQWVTRSENNSKQIRKSTNVSRGKKILGIERHKYSILKFDTLQSASNHISTNTGNMVRCCQTNYEKSKGYLFQCDWSKYNTAEFIIKQIDPNTKIIKEFKTFEEISKETGLSEEDINLCCQGKYRTLKGFIWQYANEDKLKDISQQSFNDIELHKQDGTILSFSSIAEATKNTKYNYEIIIHMLNNKNCFVYKGDKPLCLDPIDRTETLPENLQKRPVKGQTKEITSTNLETNEIKKFKSILEASIELKIDRRQITKHLNGNSNYKIYKFEPTKR
uniref:HNH nuclease domain-containing protein n=1 Tax=viral metagenome TaxID=1070528 RepID=A0A6C0J8P4_9ZZZZ